jgi:hypothetical protein
MDVSNAAQSSCSAAAAPKCPRPQCKHGPRQGCSSPCGRHCCALSDTGSLQVCAELDPRRACTPCHATPVTTFPPLLRSGAHSYGQLLGASEALVSQLGPSLPAAAAAASRGALDGPRIGVYAQPGPGYVASTWAAWMAGGIAVPLAVSHPPAELDYVLSDAGVSAVGGGAHRARAAACSHPAYTPCCRAAGPRTRLCS